jgi:uncharacterized protein YjeT (DUF2065 family)
MWHEFFVALALVFVIEGILPFLAPEAMRRAMLEMSRQTNRGLRVAGLLSMLIGVALLYFVN